MGISYPKADVSGVGIKTYTVEKGDTLSKIARENNIDYNELVDYNHIDDPNYIEVGQKIDIPTEEVDTSEYLDEQVEKKEEGIYVVQSGDTLSKIARDNNISVDELADYNHIENPDYIELGQKIVIPNKESKNATEEISDVDSNIEDQTVDTIPETEPSMENVNLNEYSDVLLTEEEIEPEGEVSQIEEAVLETEPEIEKTSIETESEETMLETESITEETIETEPITEKTTETESETIQEYTIQSGDTLSKIAQQLGVSLESILELNPEITDPAVINVNQVVKVPEGKFTMINENGETVIRVKEQRLDINIQNLKPGSRVAKAYEKYKSELDNPNLEYAVVDENIFLTITLEDVEGILTHVTHVIIEDPSQLQASYGEVDENGSRETTLESLAAQDNYVSFYNGAHYNQGGDGRQDFEGANYVAVEHGEIVDAIAETSGGYEIFETDSGLLFSEAGLNAEQLKERGVVSSWSSHDCPIITNGNIEEARIQEKLDTDTGRIWYPRTIIGMVEECEYYVTTDVGNQYIVTAAKYLQSKGVTYARSMDQGGSVGLIAGGEALKPISRKIGDGFGFKRNP